MMNEKIVELALNGYRLEPAGWKAQCTNLVSCLKSKIMTKAVGDGMVLCYCPNCGKSFSMSYD
jgi:hypothetical protein